MLEVATGAAGFRRNMCGLYALKILTFIFTAVTAIVQTLTATSTVFSCPTRLISDVQLLRAITAAINTNPLLLVAFEAVIWAPSGDQLDPMINPVPRKLPDSPESSEKGTPRRILERFSNLSLQLPIRCAPNFDTAVVRLCCQKLPNRVPTNALDKTVMLIYFAYSFLKGKNTVIPCKKRNGLGI
jgi:hypothetical protein